MKSLAGYCLLTMTFMVSSTHQMEVNIKDNSSCVFTHVASDKRRTLMSVTVFFLIKSNSKTFFCVIVSGLSFLPRYVVSVYYNKNKTKIKSCNVRHDGNFHGNCFYAWADCTQIKALSPQASSGVYQIQPPGINNSFQVPFEPPSL